MKELSRSTLLAGDSTANRAPAPSSLCWGNQLQVAGAGGTLVGGRKEGLHCTLGSCGDQVSSG